MWTPYQSPFIYDAPDITLEHDEIGQLVKCVGTSDTDAETVFEFKLEEGNKFFAVDRFNGCVFTINRIITDVRITVRLVSFKN